MTKKLKIFLAAIIILSVFAFIAYKYIMTGGSRNLNSENVTFVVTSKKILGEFASNIELSNKKYLDKAVAISGVVTSVKNHEVIIDNVVICNFAAIDISIKVDQNVSVKGRIVGLDDLLGELQMDKCVLNKN